MARLSASTIYGKLKTTGEAVVNGVLTAKSKIIADDTIEANNGIEVAGGTIDQYATVRASSAADNGHLMIDANGGNVYLARDGGETRISNGYLSDSLDANDQLIYNVDSLRDNAANCELVFDSSNNRFEFEDGSGNRTEGLFSRVYFDNNSQWFEGNHGSLAGVGATDVAESFTEDNVTFSGGAVPDNTLVPTTDPGTTASRDNDTSTWSQDAAIGIRINPNTHVTEMSVKISSEMTSTVSTVWARHSDGTLIDEITDASATAGDRFTLKGSFRPGEDYAVGIYNGGSGFDSGFPYDKTNYPYSNTHIDITGRARGGYDSSLGFSTNEPHSINDIQPIVQDAGSTYVEWPYTGSVDSWGNVSFERVLDNESVDIYIEEYSSGSWSEVAGPVSKQDNIPAASGNDVRFRIDYTLSNNSNRPRLVSIYRDRAV